MKKTAISLISFIIMLTGTLAAHAESLPSSVFQKYSISDKSSTELHALVKQAAMSVRGSPRKARKLFISAITRLRKGDTINKYDYLWTQYGLLKSTFEPSTATYGPGTKADYIKVARNVLAYLDTQHVGDWTYTEIGAFQMEVYREAGNGLSWLMLKDPKSNKSQLEKALKLVTKTESHIRGKQDFFIYDTKVRLMMKLKRQTEAFKIVKTVLAKAPGFGDFQDFNKNKAYLNWKSSPSLLTN